MLKELDSLGLPKQNYAITGSGPLAIRNIRKACDIDVIVNKTLWEKLLKQYPSFDGKHIQIQNIEIWGKFINLTPDLDSIIKNSEWIDGYPFVTLEVTLSWKKFLNREKDQKDITTITALLRK